MGKLVLQTIGGINRLRVKGGVSREVLYDLLNGYVTADSSAVSRPGTENDATLPAGTKGLCAFDGELVVFSHEAKEDMPAGYVCEVVINPNDSSSPIQDIHFAGPFLGYLYVVAEFENGQTYHYWLQRRDAWLGSTFYELGDVVEPTIRNGYAYKAHRLGDPEVTWEPNVPRAVNDVVEPTVPNGYKYTVIDTQGSAPKSGDTEPTWPTEAGATVYEDTDLGNAPAPGTGTTTPPTTLPTDVQDRYDNMAGWDGTLR